LIPCVFTRVHYPGRIEAKFWDQREHLVASWNFHTFKSVQVVANAVKERRSEEGVEKVGKQPQTGRAASRTLVQKWTRAEQRGAHS
jgi:hypothetical protein